MHSQSLSRLYKRFTAFSNLEYAQIEVRTSTEVGGVEKRQNANKYSGATGGGTWSTETHYPS